MATTPKAGGGPPSLSAILDQINDDGLLAALEPTHSLGGKGRPSLYPRPHPLAGMAHQVHPQHPLRRGPRWASPQQPAVAHRLWAWRPSPVRAHLQQVLQASQPS